MTVQADPNPRVFHPTKPRPKRQPPLVQAVPLQEQFTGPLPLRDERPAAHVLAECQAGADPDSPATGFIP